MASDWASRVGRTIEPASWAECLDLLLSSGGEGAIYRGLKVFDWELESTLERALRKHAEEWDEEKHLVMQSMVKHYPTEKWASDAENALTQGFRLRATRMRLPDIPPAWDILGWWEVMQHHRTPTRLLDWTSSPFIALWFAVEDHEDTDGDMALWVYDRINMSAKLHGLMAKLEDTEDYRRADERQFQNRLVELAVESGTGFLIPVAPRQFPRAVAQQSVLTVSTDIVVGPGLPT